MPLALATLAGDLQAVTATLRASTVAVETGRHGIGSGIAWDDARTFVTNAHVARGTRVALRAGDGRRIAGEVVARDEGRDLALVVADAPLDGVRAIVAAPPAAIVPGALVFALGHPLGIPDAVTAGVLHGLGPAPGFLALPPAVRARRWLAADVHLAPGNSGGPLADARGRVLGLNTMIVGGIALAVPIADVARFVRAAAGVRAAGATWR